MIMKILRVLVAYEESQAVTKEFRKLGHEPSEVIFSNGSFCVDGWNGPFPLGWKCVDDEMIEDEEFLENVEVVGNIHDKI